MPDDQRAQTATLRRTALAKLLLKGLIGLAGLILLLFWHIGYFGGPLFTDIPATARTPANRAGLVAVIFSGDAGYRIGMAGMIGTRLAADGIPVVGVNTLVYFRTTRTPAGATGLVSAAIEHAISFARTDRLLLIGQSYGADMLHVGLVNLPKQLRDKVQFVGLVVPGKTIEFRATPGGTLSFNVPEVPAMPTARLLDWVPAVCIHGVEEEASLCTLLSAPNVAKIAMPGGHSMHWDADGINTRLLAAIDASSRNITKDSDQAHPAVIPSRLPHTD